MKIQKSTTVDGEGMRTTVYGAGCAHRCFKCQNPQTWFFHNGTIFDTEEIAKELLEDTENITFSGGDPFYQREAFAHLAKLIKEKSNKNIWCYTGYVYENLLYNYQNWELLKYIDVLVDGPFIYEKYERDLLFKGSTNQRLIDVQASLKSGQTILYQPDTML